MPSERTNYGMLLECDGHAKYTGKKRPTCDGKKGCSACWQLHNKYLDAHRPKMSADFKEFYEYICKHKRLLQGAKMDFPTSMYSAISAIEKTIRTGQYRHGLITFDSTLDEIRQLDKRPRATQKRLKA